MGCIFPCTFETYNLRGGGLEAVNLQCGGLLISLTSLRLIQLTGKDSFSPHTVCIHGNMKGTVDVREDCP